MVVLWGTCDRLKCPALGFALFFYLRFYGTTVIFHFIYELEVASLTLTKPQGQICRSCTVSLTITSIAMYQDPLHVKI